MTNDHHRSQYRIPYPLYDRLKAEAEAGKRSVNGEIVARLEATFATTEDPVERLTRIIDERDARLLGEIRAIVEKLVERKK